MQRLLQSIERTLGVRGAPRALPAIAAVTTALLLAVTALFQKGEDAMDADAGSMAAVFRAETVDPMRKERLENLRRNTCTLIQECGIGDLKDIGEAIECENARALSEVGKRLPTSSRAAMREIATALSEDPELTLPLLQALKEELAALPWYEPKGYVAGLIPEEVGEVDPQVVASVAKGYLDYVWWREMHERYEAVMIERRTEQGVR